MAVAAAELRPRSGVMLFDAAVRLATRSTGLWALTLPGGAAVTAAAIHFLESARRGKDGWGPAFWLAAAWFFRSLCQGAAAHWTQETLLGQVEPSAARSFRAALHRLPSLCTATAMLAGGYILTTVFTLGVGVFLFPAYLVGYAAVMQGKGHPLSIWATASRLLGPARGTASAVRICLWSQLVLLLNLHLAAQAGLYLSRVLLGLDLTFASRYVSPDNPTWVLSMLAVCFSLVEPVRAALGALLLLDGRVRQEGLDLLSAVEQLPGRGRPPRVAAVGLVVVALAALVAPAARAQNGRAEGPDGLARRTMELAVECESESFYDLRQRLDLLYLVEEEHVRAYERFLDRLGQHVDEGDCEWFDAMLEGSLAELEGAAGASNGASPELATMRARAILERPEFFHLEDAEARPEEPGKPGEESAWDRFWRRVGEWLRDFFRPRRQAPLANPSFVPGEGVLAAKALVVALVAGVAVLLAVVLWRWWSTRSGEEQEATSGVVSEPLGPEARQESALSRPPEGWAALADELAARGQYREAVRGLYLAALSRLHREGALDYDPAHSNWEHVRRFKGPLQWKPPFRELTLRFDFVFYGNVGGTAEGYRAFRALSRPLLERTSEAA